MSSLCLVSYSRINDVTLKWYRTHELSQNKSHIKRIFFRPQSSRSFTRVSITGTKEKREVNARTRRCEEGLGIKGIKGIRSETKGHNAVSVNCDARIKETVTPGEKEMWKEEEREDCGLRYGGKYGGRGGGPVNVEGGERETNLWRFRSCK